MPVLPELEPLLARIRAAGPPERAMLVAQRREQVHASIDLQQVHMVEPVRALAYIDHTLPVAGGEIAIRVYRPEGRERVGCHLFVHGGGWWMGTLDQSDLACSRVAREVDCGVASVGHRWAPEHRFPVPAEDCYAALEWLATSAAELGLDPERISVGGISSGANLAAAITLMARDRGWADRHRAEPRGPDPRSDAVDRIERSARRWLHAHARAARARGRRLLRPPAARRALRLAAAGEGSHRPAADADRHGRVRPAAR